MVSTAARSKGKLSSKGAANTAKGRPRKALQQINTDLSVYDRTDPFLAFNVLLELFGSLAHRIGGNQYKISPEEHRLSLHLLTIVEPFVGLSPSRRILTRQPTEILDAIVFYVDAKRDLLSLGLSCKRMYSVVFPRHFDYRTIKCKVSSISVWNHLIMHRSLARNVRRLVILDERSAEHETVPSGISASDTDLESSDDELGMHAKQERYLVSALTKMLALHSFSWSCNHSPISIDNVWPTLLKCQSLKEIQINDNLIFSPYSSGQQLELVNSSTTRIRNSVILHDVRTVELRSTKHSYGATRSPVLSRISGMLNQCPNLESLRIVYLHPRSANGHMYPLADDFMFCSRWTHLTSLAITDLRCLPLTGFDAAAAFLSAHSNLEVLHLHIGCGNRGGGRTFILPANSLPRLREVDSSKEIINAILECQCDAPRPLETVKGVRLSGASTSDSTYQCDQDLTFFANLRKYKHTLKRIELAGWNEMEDIRRLVECAPGLTWLDVGKKNNSNFGMNAAGSSLPLSFLKDKYVPVSNMVEWAVLLSALPDLTTFHGVCFFYSIMDTSLNHHHRRMIPDEREMIMMTTTASDRSRIRKNNEIASLLAWQCPKLRSVDHWEDNTGRVIVLVRNSGGAGTGAGTSTGSGHGNRNMSMVNTDEKKVSWEVRRVKV